jgi:hypothetical protein
MAALKGSVNERARQVSPEAEKILNDYTDLRIKDAVDRYIGTIYGAKAANSGTAGGNAARKDPVRPPQGAAAKPDYRMSAEKAGGTEAMRSLLLKGKAFDAQGKPLVKNGGSWRYATA